MLNVIEKNIKVGVSAVIFNDDNKILFSLRGSQARNEQGKWEIPGGEVEYGETLEEAVMREVKEEIGVEVVVLKLSHVFDHFLSDGQHWVSLTYACRIVNGEPKIMEPGKSAQIGWYTIEEADELPLADVTKDDVKKLIKGVDQIHLPYA